MLVFMRQMKLFFLLLIGYGGKAPAFLHSVGPQSVARSPFSPETDTITYNLGRTATPSTGHCGWQAVPLVTVNRTLTNGSPIAFPCSTSALTAAAVVTLKRVARLIRQKPSPTR